MAPKVDWHEKTTQVRLADLRARQGAGPARTATLTVLSGGQAGHSVRLSEAWLVVGRGSQAALCLEDEGISRRHCQVALLAGGEVVLEDLGSTNGTFVNDQRQTRAQLAEGDKIKLGAATVLSLRFHDQIDEDFQRRQMEQATRDRLTGCLNKNAFLERLPAEFSYALRHRHPIALIVVDLDHFKQVNDGYGHLVGDKVLAAVGHSLRDALRQSDLVARFGGEEFVVLLREVQPDSAGSVAEKLRATIAGTSVEVPSGLLGVTASLGLAVWPAAGLERPDGLLELADRAVYRAKKGGRNCVQVAGAEEAPKPT